MPWEHKGRVHSAMGSIARRYFLELVTREFKGCQLPAQIRREGRMFKEEGYICAKS